MVLSVTIGAFSVGKVSRASYWKSSLAGKVYVASLNINGLAEHTLIIVHNTNFFLVNSAQCETVILSLTLFLCFSLRIKMLVREATREKKTPLLETLSVTALTPLVMDNF